MPDSPPVSLVAQRLEDDLKTAMRGRDKALVSCIRQLKAKAQEAENAPGFSGDKDDPFYLGVIGKYAKTLGKSLEELRSGGARGQALADSYQAEIAYCEQFLPKALTDSELAQAVASLLKDGGFSGIKDVGRAMGQLLSRFKGQIDPSRAKAALGQALEKMGGGAS